MRTCVVIMAAYRAEKWIREAVESVMAQQPRRGWQYKLRIGVDACEATSAELVRLGVGHWRTRLNLGPYVVRNSLIALAPGDAWAIFDADDVMKPNYLTKLLQLMGEHGIAGSGRDTINEAGEVIERRRRYVQGVSVFSDSAWQKLGGYRSWRVGADSEIVIRADRMGIPLDAYRQALYLRRQHGDNLTVHASTKGGSDLRTHYSRLLNMLNKRPVPTGPIFAETAHLDWIDGGRDPE